MVFVSERLAYRSEFPCSLKSSTSELHSAHSGRRSGEGSFCGCLAHSSWPLLISTSSKYNNRSQENPKILENLPRNLQNALDNLTSCIVMSVLGGVHSSGGALIVCGVNLRAPFHQTQNTVVVTSLGSQHHSRFAG